METLFLLALFAGLGVKTAITKNKRQKKQLLMGFLAFGVFLSFVLSAIQVQHYQHQKVLEKQDTLQSY